MPMNPFNPHLALNLAIASQQAYLQPPTIESTRTDTQVLVLPAQVVNGLAMPTVIAFRGTADIHGWLRDISVRQGVFESDKAPRLHDGFRVDVLSVLTQIRACKDVPVAEPIIVTGHSKGAAEAIIAAFLLNDAGYNVAAVYTFGQPRVGNAAWASLYGKVLGDRTWRVTHACDIVPWVPWLMGRYVHEAHEAYINPWGGLEIDPGTLNKLTTNGLELYREYLRHKWTAAGALHVDHAIGNYIAAIQNLLQ